MKIQLSPDEDSNAQRCALPCHAPEAGRSQAVSKKSIRIAFRQTPGPVLLIDGNRESNEA
jgi:hypothetical protein